MLQSRPYRGSSHLNIFEPNFELAQQKARQDITGLIGIYSTTADDQERELLAHAIRIGAAYIKEIKRQRDTAVIADSAHGYTLDMLFAYVRQAIYALNEFPRSMQGMQTMSSLLSDAVAFLREVQ